MKLETSKFGTQIEHEGHYLKTAKLVKGVASGSRDLLFEFLDPL